MQHLRTDASTLCLCLSSNRGSSARPLLLRSAGFIFVAKKDGGLRPCIDYRGLHEITNEVLVPLTVGAIEQLRGARFFTKLDLRSAYNLILEGDEWKTAFSTMSAHYEYLVMPFGLANAPSVFQKFVNKVFRDMLGRQVIVYIDILIYSLYLEDHITHIGAVLERFLAHHLFDKVSNCLFHQRVVSFLGYQIRPQGVKMDDKKVDAVRSWPVPTMVFGVCQLLPSFHQEFQLCCRSSHISP